MSLNIISEIIDIITREDTAWEPLCDVSETKDAIIIELEITDLDVNSLSVSIVNKTKVIIQGKKERKKIDGAIYLRAERVFGGFKKTIELPCYLARIKDIKYSDGLLKITLLKG